MANDIQNWRINDPRPAQPLDLICPISVRARALISRNTAKAILHTHFVQIYGAVSMLKGLDYHRDRFVEIIASLAAGTLKSDAAALHEAVAYVNRAGQFYYFAKSKLVKRSSQPPPIPNLETIIHFRHKHTAHRPLDKRPRLNTDDLQLYQAMSIDGFDGRLFHPREGHVMKHTEFPWRLGYLVFAINDGRGGFHFLNIERDHDVLMQEAYNVLEHAIQ
jgi:hypothetical protein